MKQLALCFEGYAQTFIATPLTYVQGRKAPGIRPLIGARLNSRCPEELLIVLTVLIIFIVLTVNLGWYRGAR